MTFIDRSASDRGFQAKRVTAIQPVRVSTGFETAVICAIFLYALYVGKALLLPLALAVFLTFLLSPLVDRLRKWHLPKLLAVTIATLTAVSTLLAVTLVLGQQVRTFAEDLPRYQYVLQEKIHVLKDMASANSSFARTGETIKALRDEIVGPAPKPSGPAAPSSAEPEIKPVSVVVEDRKTALDRLWSTLEVALEPLATFGIAIVFVIVLLLDRADVRDRAIRLFGTNDLERTTRAMDDAGHRLKRYFLAATAVNFAFGVVIALGLWWIGIPNPLLWGVIGMFMRFIPFVGIWLAAALPVLLALTVDPGWSMLVATLVLFIVSEILVSQVVETIVHGQSTGLSPLAIILATAFWTLLWGPAGLVLAVPLTVTLVVLGRHIERFAFLDILLGAEPALSPADSVYQRILAGDPEEAADQAQARLKDMQPDTFYDSVVMEALGKAAVDLKSGNLDAQRLAEVGASFEEFIEDIGELVDDMDTPSDNPEGAALTARQVSESPPPAPVICLAARTVIDRAGASILAQLLEWRGIPAIVATSDEVMRGKVNEIDLSQCDLICVSSFLTRERAAQTKFLLRKLRRRWPQAEIVGGFWLSDNKNQTVAETLNSIGADEIATAFAAAVDRCVMKRGNEPPAVTATPASVPRQQTAAA